MYVCVCNRVTDKQITEAVRRGADTLEAISRELRVATCCGRCRDCATRVIRDAAAGLDWIEAPAMAFG
jgi:bacterioferritin-associated ferredoxin